MSNINKLIRKNVKELKPYSSARGETLRTTGIYLDANENPFGRFNRYPDPFQKALKEKLSEIKEVSHDKIFVGNGSDEIIDLAFRIFCEPGVDKALIFTPTYGMYEVSAAVNNVEVIKTPLDDSFQIDLNAVEPYYSPPDIKLIFICSPNNPTGNIMDREAVEQIISQFNGVVVIDEAYVDFNPKSSFIDLLDKYDNLIISQTFSKAMGLAGARIGVAYSSREIIELYNKIKPPYNVSQLNQAAALDALFHRNDINKNIEVILGEREVMANRLLEVEGVKEVFPSDANFILVRFNNANDLYSHLRDFKIIVRNRSNLIADCLRITIGTPEENRALLDTIKEYYAKSVVY